MATATLYSPPLSPTQWRNSRPLNKQASSDTLSSFSNPSRSKVSAPPPTKSRFNISSVIRLGIKSKKNRVTDIIQDPPEHLYAIPIPVPVSKLQRKNSDTNLDPIATTNPRFSRGVSSISGTSLASTDGPLTPSTDPRASYQLSMMSSKSTPANIITRPTFSPEDRRHSANSDKSIGRRIKDRLNDERNRAIHRSTSNNKLSNAFNARRNDDKQHVRERTSTMPSSPVRSNLADMSSDKEHFRAEANDQEKLKTPFLSPISFQHPFVMAEAIPATLLDAHASAHPRKMSDSTFFSSRDSYGTTMSSLSRTPTMFSTSTSKSAPASGLHFISPIKSRLTSMATYSSGGPTLSTQSSMSSLKTSATQLTKVKRTAPGSVLGPGATSSGSVGPRNDSPHPPPTTSLPPTPAETGSDLPPVNTRSLSPSIRLAPSGSAPTSSARLSPVASAALSPPLSTSTSSLGSPSFVSSPEDQHLTPTSRPIASTGSTASLSTISSLAFAARPSTYAGSNSGSRSRSASRSGSVGASIPEQGQEENLRGNRLDKGGVRELPSMIDMSEDTEEEEESEIEFGDEEDILRNSDAFRDSSQRSSSATTSKTNFPSVSSNSTTTPGQSGSRGSSKSSFVRALTSSTVNVLRKQRSFHRSTSGSLNVPHNSVSPATSTSAHVPSISSPPSASSTVNVSSNPSLQTNSLSHSHPSSSYHDSHHPSSSTANHKSSQVQDHDSTQGQVYTLPQLQFQQPHQNQVPRNMRTLRHYDSFDPGMNGGNGSINNVTGVPSSGNGNGSGLDCTTRVSVVMGLNVSDNVDKLDRMRVAGTSTPPVRTTSPPASVSRKPIGRSPVTSLHSLQLQMQSSEDVSRSPPPLSSTPATSPPSEKRKASESKREKEKKGDFALPTVAEPSDDNVHHIFPPRSESHLQVPQPRPNLNDDNVDNASTVSTRPSSPRIDFAQPILTPEEISRIGEEDTLSFRRRTKSSWGSGTASIANTYLSADSAVPFPTSRLRPPGSIRHAISSSDLYNRANEGDGLLVVVRNELNDGDPNFTSLPPPPRKTKSSGFSNSSGVNSLGLETSSRSRGRKTSKEEKDKDKSRKSSRSKSKSKSKSKGDEAILDDSEPSFLDMGGSGRNVILTFEGDKEVVRDGEYVSTIGLPPKLKGSSGRRRGRDNLHEIEPSVQSGPTGPGYEYRHPYGYTESAYPRTDKYLSPFSSSPFPPPLPPRENSFLELSRGRDSMISTKQDFRFV